MSTTVPIDLVYTVTSVPTHGTLLVSGMPATQFTQQQINSGLVSYQHDGTATVADSFGLTVDDGEGTASSGTFQITIQPFAGDYNGNGTVDAADYVLWRKTLNTTGVTPYSGADGDGSGTVDGNDYTVWRSNFGEILMMGAGSQAIASAISLPQTAATPVVDSTVAPHSGGENVATNLSPTGAGIPAVRRGTPHRQANIAPEQPAIDLLLAIAPDYATDVPGNSGLTSDDGGDWEDNDAAVDAALAENRDSIAIALGW